MARISGLFIALSVLVLVAALTIGSIALGRSVQSESALLQAVVTDAGTLSPLIANRLQLRGISGLSSFVEAPDLITYDNRRDLTPYTVDAAGGSEYLTPQEAYLAAVADGHSGDVGQGAIIIIAPGQYDFGDALFEINTTGIIFASLNAASGLSGAVIFSASGLGGGLLINVPQSISANALFQGIAFGAPGDPNGFLVRLARGSLALTACTTQDSNMRVVAGGAPMGEFVTFSTFLSRFSPMPPADWFTSLDGQVQIFISNTQWIQLGFGAPVTSGGAVFNLSMGCGDMRLLHSFLVINQYDAVVVGPLPGISAGNRLVIFQACNVIVPGSNPINSFFVTSGTVNVQIIDCSIQVANAIFYQTRDSDAVDARGVYIVGGLFTSQSATVLCTANVSVIGNTQFYIANAVLESSGSPLIFEIPGATAPDSLAITLSGSTLRSTGAPGSDYALGPGANLSTLNVGACVSLNGASGQTGFTYAALTTL